MNSEAIFLGCFVSGPSVNWDDDQRTKEQAKEKGGVFRTYIWGDAGISKILKKLRSSDYGSGLNIILFQFYLNPLPYELNNLKEIENYRKKEKSIGIPIIANSENFFDREENERYQFLRSAILGKISLLENVVKRNKLDFNVEKLRADLGRIFDEALS
ncbi:hypothetical protein [Undibacterium sp. TS12]|uniref:hypothetical protein n=1 Tax=Undibacterium sp. TS12 TaxID=2908202 RepID=UPI001F4C852E|nr:hypothetical protein [Undibacterium sp. TS12]MCH8622567.1 hypothetical protein [Undibacterium sp. TS12]